MKFVALLLLLLTPAVVEAAQPIRLLEDADIRDIRKLDAEVARLFAKVRQCTAAGLAPAVECHCHYPAKLAAAKSAYRRVLAKHPEWEGRALLWRSDGRAGSSNLHLGGLKLQFNRPCLNTSRQPGGSGESRAAGRGLQIIQ